MVRGRLMIVDVWMYSLYDTFWTIFRMVPSMSRVTREAFCRKAMLYWHFGFVFDTR